MILVSTWNVFLTEDKHWIADLGSSDSRPTPPNPDSQVTRFRRCKFCLYIFPGAVMEPDTNILVLNDSITVGGWLYKGKGGKEVKQVGECVVLWNRNEAILNSLLGVPRICLKLELFLWSRLGASVPLSISQGKLCQVLSTGLCLSLWPATLTLVISFSVLLAQAVEKC